VKAPQAHPGIQLVVVQFMRIAQVAPLAEPVPPDRYGGTERVVACLTDELVRRGHKVTLFASGDSGTDADLVPATAKSLRRDKNATDPVAPHIGELGMAFARADEFDIMHSHLDYLAFPAARLSATPKLHTLHGRLDSPHVGPVFGEFRELPLVSISNAQREPLRDLGLNWAGTIYHGIRVEDSPFVPTPGRHLAFCGRICPEKRPDLAIEVACRVGLSLKIAAKVDDVDRQYFERDIRPLLDHPGIDFLGELDEVDKRQLLAEALALLFPIDWPEPFGLVMIEAMACGTPVITRPFGAAAEVVVDGRTGFIAESIEDLVSAVKRADTLDRTACRRHVEQRFSVSRMVDEYETLLPSRSFLGRIVRRTIGQAVS
jgi:glycosyltransferase involved in cell wall biosynthesis